ncbi:hypothetical protein GCM10009602_33050 [Nocardiopsis tropica]
MPGPVEPVTAAFRCRALLAGAVGRVVRTPCGDAFGWCRGRLCGKGSRSVPRGGVRQVGGPGGRGSQSQPVVRAAGTANPCGAEERVVPSLLTTGTVVWNMAELSQAKRRAQPVGKHPVPGFVC